MYRFSYLDKILKSNYSQLSRGLKKDSIKSQPKSHKSLTRKPCQTKSRGQSRDTSKSTSNRSTHAKPTLPNSTKT